LLVIGSVAGIAAGDPISSMARRKEGSLDLLKGWPISWRHWRPRRIDKARFRRYANDRQLQEQGTAMGSARASGARDRGGGAARRANRLRAGLLALIMLIIRHLPTFVFDRSTSSGAIP